MKNNSNYYMKIKHTTQPALAKARGTVIKPISEVVFKKLTKAVRFVPFFSSFYILSFSYKISSYIFIILLPYFGAM